MKPVASSGRVQTAPQDDKTVRDFGNFICFIAGEVTLLMRKVFDDGADEPTGNHEDENLFRTYIYGVICTLDRTKASVNPPEIID
ncbi:unnamed protein product, partial [Brassica oleracea var. botrytis]